MAEETQNQGGQGGGQTPPPQGDAPTRDPATVEQGRSELLPKGVERRPPSEAKKESDLSPEQLRAIERRDDPLASASNEVIAGIREELREEAGEHATMPAPGRNDVSAEEVARRHARRETLTGDASADAQGETFGGETVSVAESRRRLLAGQMPAEAMDATGTDADFAVRDAGASRLNDMRRMAAQRMPAPSGAAQGGRVRQGDGGDALRPPAGAQGGQGGQGSPANASSTEEANRVTPRAPVGGAGTPAGGAQEGAGGGGTPAGGARAGAGGGRATGGQETPPTGA